MFIFLLSLYLDKEKRAVFTDLYERYKKLMFRDALAILKNKKDAEDAVQTACLFLLPHINDEVFNEIKSENAEKYIRETVKNAAVKILDKHVSSDQFDDKEAYYDFEDNVIDRVIQKDLYDAVINTINSMDEIYRDVLYRHYVLGQTIKEIAKITHAKPATIEKRISRGKKIIIEKVNPDEYGYK